MKKFLLGLMLLMLTGCAAVEDESVFSAISLPDFLPQFTVKAPEPDPIRSRIDEMSLEERVGQLFLARCDASVAAEHAAQYHLGGFVLFGADFEGQTPESMKEIISSYQDASEIPLLIAVDEEGGIVNRVSRYPAFRESPFASPRDLYAAGGMESVLETEIEKCRLLRSLGINVNIGPVCDISTDSGAFMYRRSLGQDPDTTAEFVSGVLLIADNYQIGSVLKHFPGYGNNADTHTGIAVDNRTLSQLESADLLPFAAGIRDGCDAILVSHTVVSALDSEFPASLSPAVHTYLRETMGFAGVIVTDDLVMEAITQQYGAGEAAVLAVQAGNDLLCATDYVTQYEAVLAAVLDGRISIDTLNAAVTRVLQWKMDLGLL